MKIVEKIEISLKEKAEEAKPLAVEERTDSETVPHIQEA